MTTGSAPGKIILFGEHAVVYGRPAIAAPVSQLAATATVMAAEPGNGCVLDLSDIGETVPVTGESAMQPLALVTRLTLDALEMATPDWRIVLRSTIPVSSGLGSGAAAATAIVRAIAAAAGHALTPAEISTLVFESERLFHGTPSGIDNTMATLGTPLVYRRGAPPLIETLNIPAPLKLVVGMTHHEGLTARTVASVAEARQRNPRLYEKIFDDIDALVLQAVSAIQDNDIATLGDLMNINQGLLNALQVSTPELERLIGLARKAGAAGAKLTGGGGGGAMIALCNDNNMDIQTAIERQGFRTMTVTAGRKS